MGEAKRRETLDYNFGKPPEMSVRILKDISEAPFYNDVKRTVMAEVAKGNAAFFAFLYWRDKEIPFVLQLNVWDTEQGTAEVDYALDGKTALRITQTRGAEESFKRAVNDAVIQFFSELEEILRGQEKEAKTA